MVRRKELRERLEEVTIAHVSSSVLTHNDLSCQEQHDAHEDLALPLFY